MVVIVSPYGKATISALRFSRYGVTLRLRSGDFPRYYPLFDTTPLRIATSLGFTVISRYGLVITYPTQSVTFPQRLRDESVISADLCMSPCSSDYITTLPVAGAWLVVVEGSGVKVAKSAKLAKSAKKSLARLAYLAYLARLTLLSLLILCT